MAFIGTAAPFSAQTNDYDSALKNALSKGWVVASEGPSGAQLRKPKRMRLLDTLCLVTGVGVAMLYNLLLGGALVLAAVIDYALLTKERTAFLSRSAPGTIE